MFAYRALVLCNTALFFSKGCRMKKQLSGLDRILCYLIISSTHPIAPWNICPFMHIVPHEVGMAYPISFKTGHFMFYQPSQYAHYCARTILQRYPKARQFQSTVSVAS